MASNKTTYQQSIDELRQIIEHIESEEISVDELDKKVKRGAKLIQQCKEKLKSTENSVNQVLENLDQYQSDDQEEQSLELHWNWGQLYHSLKSKIDSRWW